jgi:putative hemolysin
MNAIEEQIINDEVRSDLVSAPAEKGFYRRFLKGDSPDLDAVLRLRYRVFNLELQEGLLRSHLSGKDEDGFDRHCDHLVIYEKGTGEPVGTYRLQTFEMAQANIGFYSSVEFDFSRFPEEYRKAGVEIGRVCIEKDHRNVKALFLLWKGLMKYLEMKEKRFLFGCASLTEQDPREGWRAFDYLCTHGYMHPEIFLGARPDFECGEYPEAPLSLKKATIPRLLKAYLNLGARICSEPALDRAFGTIDFFTLLAMDDLDEKTFNFFAS